MTSGIQISLEGVDLEALRELLSRFDLKMDVRGSIAMLHGPVVDEANRMNPAISQQSHILEALGELGVKVVAPSVIFEPTKG